MLHYRVSNQPQGESYMNLEKLLNYLTGVYGDILAQNIVERTIQHYLPGEILRLRQDSKDYGLVDTEFQVSFINQNVEVVRVTNQKFEFLVQLGVDQTEPDAVVRMFVFDRSQGENAAPISYINFLENTPEYNAQDVIQVLNDVPQYINEYIDRH